MYIIQLYCTFHKHANSKVQKPPSQLRFSLPSIIITITSNEPWNTETHKTDRNPPITNHKPWPFEPVKVKFCFLRGPLRGLTAAKNAIVSWLLNFRIRIFVKSAVIDEPSKGAIHSTKIPTGPTRKSGPSQKVDPFFRNFSGWTEPILWVLDRNFRKFWLNGSRPRSRLVWLIY